MPAPDRGRPWLNVSLNTMTLSSMTPPGLSPMRGSRAPAAHAAGVVAEVVEDPVVRHLEEPGVAVGDDRGLLARPDDREPVDPRVGPIHLTARAALVLVVQTVGRVVRGE